MTNPLVVLHVLPDLAVGGGQILLLRQIAAKSAGVRHHVAFVRDKRDMQAAFERAGAACHFVESAGSLGFRKAGRKIAALARSINASVIHTNNTGLDRRPGMVAADLAGVPLVNTLHAEGATKVRSRRGGMKGLITGVARAWEDRLARRVTRGVIAVSRHVLSSWQWRLDEIGIAESSVRVIHPGLDLTAFDAARGSVPRETLRTELLRGRRGPLLVHVGRLAEGKGHYDLIPVIRRVREKFPGVVMLCVGDGPLRSGFEADLTRGDVADAFHLTGDRKDVPAILGACDLMLFPSYSEGFGLAPLEAMAAGIPVVSHNLPSVREFLGEGGMLVPIGGHQEMVEAACSLLLDVPRAARMGHAGRGIVERSFTVQRFVGQHEALYREIAGAAGGTGARRSGA